MRYIDCKKYADEIIAEVAKIPDKRKSLLVLTAGYNFASEAYMRGKKEDCQRCGINFNMYRADNQWDLMETIRWANNHDTIGGIIVQLPLPEGFDADEAINEIKPEKDVDGFLPDSPFHPCTPEGIIHILDREIGELEGKTVLLVGKGKLVGKPLIDMLLERGCTLTIAHSRTKDLDDLVYENRDIIISAVGKPNVCNLEYNVASVVIDAGINVDENGKLCGDCYNVETVYDHTKVTPVPRGVGLMTRAMLMKHMGEVNGGDE
jgi:methylenetetrahydrofolate dehydrogenase (NADP+)/methenyltetrahydrofolate cyclohydrolase